MGHFQIITSSLPLNFGQNRISNGWGCGGWVGCMWWWLCKVILVSNSTFVLLRWVELGFWQSKICTLVTKPYWIFCESHTNPPHPPQTLVPPHPTYGGEPSGPVLRPCLVQIGHLDKCCMDTFHNDICPIIFVLLVKSMFQVSDQWYTSLW